jgi:hypothetical protein
VLTTKDTFRTFLLTFDHFQMFTSISICFWAPGLAFEHHHVLWPVCNYFQTFSTVFNRLNLPALVLSSRTCLVTWITPVFERTNHALSVHSTHFRRFLTVLKHFWPFTLVFDQYNLFSSTSTRFQTLPPILNRGLDFWLVTPPSRLRQRSSKTNSFITNPSKTTLIPLPSLSKKTRQKQLELSASFFVYVAESIAEDQSTHARTGLLLNASRLWSLSSFKIQLLSESIERTSTPCQQDKPTSPS